MKTAVRLLATALPLICGGCTWVTVPSAPGAANHVATLDASQAAKCQLLSRSDLSVGTAIGAFQRLPADVAADLQTLAVNRAVDAGGNGVAPLTDVKDGHQTFGIYKCGAASAPAAAAATPAPTPTTAPSASTAVKTIPYNPPPSD